MVTYLRIKLVVRIKEDKGKGPGTQARTLHEPITTVVNGSENREQT